MISDTRKIGAAVSGAQAVIECRLCGSRVTVSRNRGTLRVRCPSCGNEASWTPQSEHPVTPTHSAEVREVHFHCAKTRDRFSVMFARDATAQKFRVRSIQILKRSSYARRTGIKHRPLSAFDAHDFDVSGWQCACCGHGSGNVETLFVKCPACHRLVCGAKVISIQNGSQTFECAPDCGHVGSIAGEIATYDAALDDRERKNGEYASNSELRYRRSEGARKRRQK